MPLNLDERDVKILCQLQQNARISVAELSNLVHLSRSAVSERIKRLETIGYIHAYAAILNKPKINKNLVSFTGIRLHSNTQGNLSSFLNEIKGSPELSNCYRINGMFDFLLHIVVADMEEYRNYLTHNLSEIENVSAIQTFFVLDESHGDHQVDLRYLLKTPRAKPEDDLKIMPAKCGLYS
jgi:Lrp/AsnC family leucine-responsive transcriptional regulator